MATKLTRTPPEPPPAPPVSDTPEPALIRRERDLVHGLRQLAAERAQIQAEAEAAFRAHSEEAEQAFEEDRRRLLAEYQAKSADAQRRYDEVRRAIDKRYEEEHAAAEQAHTEERRQAGARYYEEREAAKAEYEETRWTATTVHEAERTKAEEQFRDVQPTMSGYLQKTEALQGEAEDRFDRWLRIKPPEPVARQATDEDLPGQMAERAEAAEALLAEGRALFLPRFLRGPQPYAVLAAVWLLALLPAILVGRWRYAWIAGATVVVAGGGAGVIAWLYARARAQVAQVYVPLMQALADLEGLCKRYHERAAGVRKRQVTRSEERHSARQRQTEAKHQKRQTEATRRRDAEQRQVEEEYQRRLAEATQHRDTDLGQAHERFPHLLADLKDRYERADEAVNDRYHHKLSDLRAAYEGSWEALTAHWHDGLEQVRAEAEVIGEETAHLFPDWSGRAWGDWRPPTEAPSVIRFGGFEVCLDKVADGIPEDERLRGQGPDRFPLPALMPLADGGSLLFKAPAEGRIPAEQALQAVMYRLLTAVPPAKVRFTIIDPVGLGQNFAAFMHLADDDEALVSSRIWTEQQHIEQRLADLTAHMENVIQRCLRNQFRNIEEYNAQAGEVAEPLRFLVVANFPANFSPEAARRLLSIMASGARCGVHTLITVDTRQSMPQGFVLRDLEQFNINLVWEGGRFIWRDRDFGTFPFLLDPPPDAVLGTRLLQQVGGLAREASRVEVPFSWVCPEPARWWTEDSRGGVQVPLGRVGATKRQFLSLGRGTSQHVLIAGKTGSGKSTLLHALITNVSLLYSPEEMELYLVDFKEGVEFKAYATHNLPHARVVAIESEREFGVSVLQRLDQELKERGEKFRALGVQDLAGYRDANGTPLPRVLLIVDEFQLFFMDDDKIAQDAALLLDRLVRQGRAFGIHVLLGSQTLGGAYSLARSTIGQMAVRVALQCSETDAHLILSDDNPAARLLSRPGEAIYNAANGLVEGNDFFQVVWLPDDQRDGYLAQIADMARRRGYTPPRPQIVFEGRAPAEVGKNHLLEGLLRADAWTPSPRVLRAWLGEAIAIKDPTAADFRRQSGSNLLVVGQSDEAALALTVTSVLSLAAQLPAPMTADGPGTRFYVLDGSAADAAHAGFLERLTDLLPHPVRVVGWRDLPAVIDEVAREVERRQEAREAEGPAHFLVIHGLQRFRELRKADEDFGFSRRGEEKPSPGRQFGTILRDGPAVGIHTLVWCDGLNNVNRALDRQTLREFEMRVLFQMSAADSSNLIDSPLASKLGLHRAFFHSEDRGQPEKFRPYGLPSDEWLAFVRSQLQGRAGGA